MSSRFRPALLTKAIVVAVLLAPLGIGALVRAHGLPNNQQHATGLNRYIFNSTIPAGWQSHVNWGGDRWDAVPNQTHEAFQAVDSSVEFTINRLYIDGQWPSGAVVSNMTVLHSGSVETLKFDSAESWYAGSGTPGSNQFDLRTFAIHELGHALYLAHSSGSLAQADTMYFATPQPGATKRTLTANDQARMQDIY